MTAPATVFIVDDDVSVRSGLTRMLRALGYDVEAFASGDEFAARETFDGEGCVILDLRMPGVSGADVQRRLRERSSDLPVIFLSGHGAVPDSVRAMKQGAADFLTKPVDAAVLQQAIEAALAAQRVGREARGRREAVRERLADLTPREHAVLRHVIAGALNKQIADALGIAEGTVKVHRGRVMAKLGAGSVAELVRLCDAAGVPPVAGPG
jgi:FixJ family two-component response regulator